MIRTFKERREQEEGFTLIELMVVVLIIAILLAIAIPTFLGARQRANDRAAQSSLRNALTAAKTIYTDSQDYSTATSTALRDVEPSLTFVADAAVSTTFKTVSVGSLTTSSWAAASLSKSNKCFFIKDVVSTGTGGGTKYGSVDSDSTGAGCSGTAATAAAASDW
jgi:type IV pilus assembly protein PilA